MASRRALQRAASEIFSASFASSSCAGLDAFAAGAGTVTSARRSTAVPVRVFVSHPALIERLPELQAPASDEEEFMRRWLEMERMRSQTHASISGGSQPPYRQQKTRAAMPPVVGEEEAPKAPGWRELLAAAEASKAVSGEQILTDTYG